MSKSRDYGSFSNACERLFSPMIAPLGWESMGGIKFNRPHTQWADALFLQQSQWGSGKFSATLGIHVPMLATLWQSSPTFGVIVGGRLSEKGVGNDRWLPAENKAELVSSLSMFASFLSTAMPWFEQFRDVSDIASFYKAESGLGEQPTSHPDVSNHLAWANYGMLLVIAGNKAEASPWLYAALESMSKPTYLTREKKIVFEKIEGARLIKKSAEAIRQTHALKSLVSQYGTGAL